jgi:hypothetical protein
MASPVLDYGSFSPTQLTNMLTAAQAEYLLRITTGRVRSGSSAAQSYGLDVMTIDDLIRLINGLTAELGLSNTTTAAAPDFSQGSFIPSLSTFGAGPP